MLSEYLFIININIILLYAFKNIKLCFLHLLTFKTPIYKIFNILFIIKKIDYNIIYSYNYNTYIMSKKVNKSTCIKKSISNEEEIKKILLIITTIIYQQYLLNKEMKDRNIIIK
jgi:hypothetical protein